MKLKHDTARRAGVIWLTSVSATLLLAGGFYAWWMTGQRDLGRAVAEADMPVKPTSTQQYPDQKSPTVATATQRAAVSARGAGKIEISSLFPPDIEDQLADSPEEAEWLRTHGYPSLGDIEFMNDLSLDQLSDLAKTGSRVAQALLGTRLALAEGNFDEGLKILESSAVNDSVYALAALANVHEVSGNVVLAQGYRIAAMLRGDYETVFAHNLISSFSNQAPPQWETSLGFLAGQAIIDHLNQIRVSSGMGTFPQAVPRPGAEEAYQRALQELERLANQGTRNGQAVPGRNFPDGGNK